ncbi:MAG: metallophosphoesterase [archaeon]
MKILAIGDFHGKFPNKLLRRIKKEKFDLILSPGDFCGNMQLSKLFFKYAYGCDKELWEYIGKRKVNKLEKKNLEDGVGVGKKINLIGKKVIATKGNWDPTNIPEPGSRYKDPFTKKFNAAFKKLKNIKIVDFKSYKYQGYNFVGYPRSSYPGHMTPARRKRLKKRNEREINKIIKMLDEDNKKYFKRIKKQFKPETIFITHNAPYNTKLDLIKKGPQKGKHYGSYLARKVIKELKPILVVCGHMHENQGKQKVGRSWVVNTGAAYEGKAAIIDLDGKRVKSIKFLRGQ